VGGLGIVGFKDGAAVDQDLPDRRVQYGGEGFPAGILAREGRCVRLLGFDPVVFLA